MRFHMWLRLALLAGVAVSMSGCSFIGGLFPDKQKQYRYSSELPDLEVPPDLGGSKVGGKLAEDEGRPDEAVSSAAGKTKLAPTGSSGKSAKKKRKHLNDSSVTLAESSENASLIELNEPYAEAWNDVSRALGRMKIEIFDQNRTDGVFFVYYGGQPPKKDEEAGVWDTVVSVFDVEKDRAKEYRVKLEDKEDFTFIKVLDQSDSPQSTGPGFDLLSRLHKKLMTLDQPEPEGEEGKRAEEAEKRQNENGGTER